MNIFTALVKREPKVLDYQGTKRGQGYEADVAINGKKRQVALFRPPTILDAAGVTVPGVSRDMIGQYMVATVSSLSGVDLGIVNVDWQGQVGRFALADFQLQSWGQQMRVMAPVNVISQKVNIVMTIYRKAICLKAKEVHRGKQDYSKPNKLLAEAARELEKLRNDEHPHLSDAEYLFVASEIQAAMVRNALIPLHTEEGEQVVHEQSQAVPEPGRGAMVTDDQELRR